MALGTQKMSNLFSLGSPVDGKTSSFNEISELLSAYKTTTTIIEGWGPTNLAPIVRYFGGLAKEDHIVNKQSGKAKLYRVLVIMTDGKFHDMPETKEAIIKGSEYALSIIIIGIGDEDFGNMVELDSDGELLKVTVRGVTLEAKRDIVQFVEMNKFMVKPKKSTLWGRLFGRGGNVTDARVNLTKNVGFLRDKDAIRMVKAELDDAVLYEVVPQATQYFTDNQLAPDSPPAYDAHVIKEIQEIPA